MVRPPLGHFQLNRNIIRHSANSSLSACVFDFSGGGIGGLICALAMSRFPDIRVDVYEAAYEFAELGAGIGLWPRAWKILESLGLDHDLGQVAVVPPTNLPSEQTRFFTFTESSDHALQKLLGVAFTFRKGDQPLGVSFSQLITPGACL